MTLEEKYKAQYEEGFPIFKKLFQLTKKEFIKVMKDIFKDDARVLQILENNPKVIKTLEDDEPAEIIASFYSSIKVTYLGVEYIPEHGAPTRILKFDKFFNVDAASK